MPAGVFAHGWIGHTGVNMSHLLPQMLGCPAHAVVLRVMFDDVAPMVGAALLAVQLFKPLVAQYKYWVCINHKSSSFGRHSALLQCFCAQ